MLPLRRNRDQAEIGSSAERLNLITFLALTACAGFTSSLIPLIFP